MLKELMEREVSLTAEEIFCNAAVELEMDYSPDVNAHLSLVPLF